MKQQDTDKRAEAELEECRYIFKAVYNTIDTAVFIIRVEPEDRFVFEGLNPAHERLTGLRSEAVKDKTAREFLPAKIAEAVEVNYRNCVLSGRTIEYEESLQFEGKMTDWITKLVPVKNESGQIARIIGTSTFVTPMKEAELRAKEERDFVYQLINALGAPVFYTDCDLSIIGNNRAFYELFSDGTRELKGRSVFDFIVDEDRETFREAMLARNEARADSFNAEVRMQLRGSEGHAVMALQCAPYDKGDGTCSGIIAVVNDISEKEVRLRELSERAIRDELTELFNRRGFNELASREWASAMRNCLPVSVLMIDIDHFKIFNDTYGHPAGDEVIARVSKILMVAAMRPTDIVARYGGEEFVILLANTNAGGALTVARRIQEMLREQDIPHRNSPVQQYVTVSVGIASIEELKWRCGDEAVELGPLVENADRLL